MLGARPKNGQSTIFFNQSNPTKHRPTRQLDQMKIRLIDRDLAVRKLPLGLVKKFGHCQFSGFGTSIYMLVLRYF